jgi:UDP-2,3-diacylglucosamine pyrophosphatase LpxH
MLVIFSDIHLTDESTANNVSKEAFLNVLLPEIRSNAHNSNATEIHIVLLGDIFDFVRTSWWHRNPAAIRPWHGFGKHIDVNTAMHPNSAELEKQFHIILDAILSKGSAKALVDMAKAIPTETGKPTKITYVRGNHDRVLNNFGTLETKIKEAFKPIEVTFATHVDQPAYGVFARHGHEWDENCSARILLNKVLHPTIQWQPLDPAINKFMAIGEVVTAELMGGLIYYIEAGVGGQMGNPGLALKLREVNNVRPLTDVFYWLEWISGRLNDVDKELLRLSLIEAINGVVESDYGKHYWDEIQWNLVVSGDLVDNLKTARTALRAGGFDDFRALIRKLIWLKKLLPEGEDHLYKGAVQEFKALSEKERGIQYLLYGHTHVARQDCFSAVNGGTIQMYLNTGTYLPLFQRTVDETGFFNAYQMTMAFFYSKDEDTGDKVPGTVGLDLWNGIKRKLYK